MVAGVDVRAYVVVVVVVLGFVHVMVALSMCSKSWCRRHRCYSYGEVFRLLAEVDLAIGQRHRIQQMVLGSRIMSF